MVEESVSARLNRERRRAVLKLQQLRSSSELTRREAPGDESADEGDRAQASLRQHLDVSTCERLAERIGRLDEALRRVHEGIYGRCEHCEAPIGARRLAAIPEATSCVACQQAREGLPAGYRRAA
jgi:DnaK suppressor protein